MPSARMGENLLVTRSEQPAVPVVRRTPRVQIAARASPRARSGARRCGASAAMTPLPTSRAVRAATRRRAGRSAWRRTPTRRASQARQAPARARRRGPHRRARARRAIAAWRSAPRRRDTVEQVGLARAPRGRSRPSRHCRMGVETLDLLRVESNDARQRAGVALTRRPTRRACRAARERGRRDEGVWCHRASRGYRDISVRREPSLQAIDRLDADRVGAAQHGERRARRGRRAATCEMRRCRRVSPRGATRSTCAPRHRRSRPSARSRAAIRSPASGSSRKTAANGAKDAAASQPTISLWSTSGSSAANAGIFAFSLNWHFQR